MPDQAAELRNIFKEKEQKKENKNNSYIITIASGKGGVGKSTLSVNIGMELADNGKKVTIMDADFGLANINVILGVLPKYTLYHVFKEEKELSDIILNVDDNLNIIAGASGFSQLADLTSKQRKIFLEQLETLDGDDIIIIDAGAGISQNVISMILASNESIIVTTPEPTAITDAYGIIKAIAARDNKVKINLVVNKAKNIIEAKKVAERMNSISEQFLGMSLNYIGFILDDRTVYKSIREQDPFVRRYANSPAALCVKRIANKLLEKNDDSEEKNNFKKFIKKMFGFK